MTKEQISDNLYSLLLDEFLNGSYANDLFDAPCRVEDITIDNILKVVKTDSQLRITGNGTVEATIFLGGGEAKDGVDINDSSDFSFSVSTDLDCIEIIEIHSVNKI